MSTPQDALSQLLPTIGWPSDAAADVTFTGGNDPVLPTPFRVGIAGAATVAAAGLAAARLWEQRTGRRQQVTVELRQATASLRSGTYMKLGDGALSHARNRIMGFYPTKDGRWSYLHCNFPNHRAVALKVLGVPEDRAAVAKAVTSGMRRTSRKRSSPARVRAAWCAARRNGRTIPRRTPSPPCR